MGPFRCPRPHNARIANPQTLGKRVMTPYLGHLWGQYWSHYWVPCGYLRTYTSLARVLSYRYIPCSSYPAAIHLGAINGPLNVPS
jgi:hypothetical protein